MLTSIKKLDWILIISTLLLVIIGLISIYSSSLREGDFSNFKKQIIFVIIAFSLMFIFAYLDWKAICANSYLILFLYFLSILTLIGLFFFAPITRGIKGWYKIGPISFDPIELNKIILLILLAKYFSTRHIEMYRLKHIFLSGFYVLLPAVLILRQPDFGSAIILIALWTGVLIISGIKLRHFLFLVLCGLIILLSSWSFILKDYQKERLISFLVPEVEPLGISWNQNQAKIAIGSGGIFGQGFTKGSQTRYGFLPEPHTDFIFASISEEFGLIGVSILLLLFLLIIWRVTKIAIASKSNFPRLFTAGFNIILISQVFIHIGMNLGILPVIGISLPLVSYGGSGLVAIFISIGILLSIKRQQ